MHRSMLASLALLMTVLAAPVAQADPLPFQASYTLELPGFSPTPLSGTAVGTLTAIVTAGSNVNTFTVPSSHIYLSTIRAATSPLVPQLTFLSAINDFGVFAGGGGQMALLGTAAFAFLGLSAVTSASLGIIGVAGTHTFFALPGTLRLEATLWNLGTVGVSGQTTFGTGIVATRMGGLTTFITSGAGSPSSDIVKHSVFTWVTPIQYTAAFVPQGGGFGTFTIDIAHTIGHVTGGPVIPEPSSAILFALGVGLVGYGLRRRT